MNANSSMNFGNILIAKVFTASTSKSASLSNGSRLNGQIIAFYEKFKVIVQDDGIAMHMPRHCLPM